MGWIHHQLFRCINCNTYKFCQHSTHTRNTFGLILDASLKVLSSTQHSLASTLRASATSAIQKIFDSTLSRVLQCPFHWCLSQDPRQINTHQNKSSSSSTKWSTLFSPPWTTHVCYCLELKTFLLLNWPHTSILGRVSASTFLFLADFNRLTVPGFHTSEVELLTCYYFGWTQDIRFSCWCFYMFLFSWS